MSRFCFFFFPLVWAGWDGKRNAYGMEGEKHPQEATAVTVFDCASELSPGHEKFWLQAYIIQKRHGDEVCRTLAEDL